MAHAGPSSTTGLRTPFRPELAVGGHPGSPVATGADRTLDPSPS